MNSALSVDEGILVCLYLLVYVCKFVWVIRVKELNVGWNWTFYYILDNLAAPQFKGINEFIKICNVMLAIQNLYLEFVDDIRLDESSFHIIYTPCGISV